MRQYLNMPHNLQFSVGTALNQVACIVLCRIVPRCHAL